MKKLIKRITALFACACLFAANALPVHAEVAEGGYEPDIEGYWELYDKGFFSAGAAVTSCSLEEQKWVLPDRPEDTLAKYYGGNYSIKATGFPQTWEPGDLINIHVNGSTSMPEDSAYLKSLRDGIFFVAQHDLDLNAEHYGIKPYNNVYSWNNDNLSIISRLYSDQIHGSNPEVYDVVRQSSFDEELSLSTDGVCIDQNGDRYYTYEQINDDYRSFNFHGKKDEYLSLSMITVWDESYAVSYYVYHYNTGEPPLITQNESVNANESAGEDEGIVINEEIVEPKKKKKSSDKDEDDGSKAGAIGGGALVGAAVAGATAADKKKKKGGSTFRLHISKDFGDTLIPGEQKQIFARIIETDEKGRQKSRPDLSENIRIYAGNEAVQVKPDGLLGEYQAATIAALAGSELDEAVVSFTFYGDGGTFTENVHFKIDEPRLVFGQEAIAVPSFFKDPFDLPFEVKCFDLDSLQITVTPSENYIYACALVNSELAPQLFTLAFVDINTAESDPGTCAESVYHIEAFDKFDHRAEKDITVYCITEGLSLSVGAINCYRVLKESSAEKPINELVKDDFCISYSDVYASVLIYDPSGRTFRQLPVDDSMKIEITPSDETVGSARDNVQATLDAVAIGHRILEKKDGVSKIRFAPTGDPLEPPQRVFVKISATFMYAEKQYRFERDGILLRSQPLRLIQTDEQMEYCKKHDAEQEDVLREFLRIINVHGLNTDEDLGAEYMMIQQMLHGYDVYYGYDPVMMTLLHQNIDFYFRQLKYKSLRDRMAFEERYQRSLEAYDCFMIHFFRALAIGKEQITGTGWTAAGTRAGLAFASGGWSEVIFTPIDVLEAGVNYFDNTLVEDITVTDTLTAAVSPIVIGAIAGGLIKVGVVVGVGMVKGAIGVTNAVTPSLIPSLKGYIMTAANATLNKVPASWRYYSKSFYQTVKGKIEQVKAFDPRREAIAQRNAVNDIKAYRNQVSQEVDELLALVKKMPRTPDQKFEEMLLKAANKDAGESVAAFEKAVNALKAQPEFKGWFKDMDVQQMIAYVRKISLDPKNATRAYELQKGLNNVKSKMLDVSSSNFKISKLKNLGRSADQIKNGEFTVANGVRAFYNEAQETMIKFPAKAGMVKDAARYSSCKPSDIRTFNATGNNASKLVKGYTSGADIDESLMKQVGNKAAVYYNQAESEMLGGVNYAKAIKSDALGNPLEHIAGDIPTSGEISRTMSICEKYKVAIVSVEHGEFYHNFKNVANGSRLATNDAAANMKASMYKCFNEADKGVKEFAEIMGGKNRSSIMRNVSDYLNGQSKLGEEAKAAISALEKQRNMYDQFPKRFEMLLKQDASGIANGSGGVMNKTDLIAAEIASRVKTGQISAVDAQLAFSKLGTNSRDAISKTLSKSLDINANAGNALTGAPIYTPNIGEGISAGSATAGNELISDAKKWLNGEQ